MSLVLALSTALMCSAAATAQVSRLSTRLLTADSLTPEQVGDVQKWADALSAQLIEGASAKTVADARTSLVEPLNNTLTKPVPRSVITEEVAKRIVPAIKSEDLAVQMNALIVASETPHAAIGPMIVPGLESPSPAVRYWAAKACAQIMSQRPGGEVPFDDATQAKILAAITAAAPKETSDPVVDQMFQALASLTIQPARAALFDILRQRVGGHMESVNLGLRADVAAIEKLHRQIVVDVASGRAVGPALRDLTAVTAQYLQIATNAIAAGDADAALKPVLESVVSIAQKVFDLAVGQFAQELQRRPILEGVKDKPAELQLNVSEWVGTPQQPGILTSTPIGIPFDKLQLPGKAAAPAPTPAPAE